MDSAPEPPVSPPLSALPATYRVWRRGDGSWWRLGRGLVYKATDTRTQETVALRFLDAGPRTRDAMDVRAEYAARLARPGSPLVAPLRDFFVSGEFHVAATGFVAGESLAERVRRAGPLKAGPAWSVARQLLEALGSLHALGLAHGHLGPSKVLFPDGGEPPGTLRLVEAGLHPSASLAADPAAGSDATREDLRRLGATLWFALTGHDLDAATSDPLPWRDLDAAGITPGSGGLPVVLARTLTGEPAQRPPTAPALLATLNVLAPLGSLVPGSPAMPSRVPAPVAAAAPEPRPAASAYEDEEWLPRPGPRPAAPNRRRRPRLSAPGRPRKPWRLWTALTQLALGGVAGFFVGVNHERHHGWEGWFGGAPVVTAPVLSPSSPPPDAPTPAPEVALLPSPPVSAAAANVRLQRIRRLQPDVGDILRYARQWRRVATLPVADLPAFPSDAQVGQLLARFDWNHPESPDFHRTALLLVLGYADASSAAASQAASRQSADVLAQVLAANGVTSPIYACGMGSADQVPEVETGRPAGGPFVEVWVAFTLF